MLNTADTNLQMQDMFRLHNDERVLSAKAFIDYEATVLDDKDYSLWNTLWSNDNPRYVIPIQRDIDDYDSVLNYVNDDERMRHLRTERLSGGFAHAANTTGPIVRSVSRVTVLGIETEYVRLRSAQLIVAMKKDQQQVWAADVEHKILFEDSVPKIQEKIVKLVDSELSLRTCGFLL